MLPHYHGVGALFTEPTSDSILSNTIGGFPRDPRTETDYSIGQLQVLSAWPTTVIPKAIEFGWIVSPSTYQNNEPYRPHLFIALRNGPFKDNLCLIHGEDAVLGPENERCPEGIYIQPSQAKNRPGSVVGNIGHPMMYHIGYYPGNKAWWIRYGDEWLGYVYDSHWSNTGGFAAGNTVGWQGEVVFKTSPEAPMGDCVPMGNGLSARFPASASISDMFYEIMQGDTSIAVDAAATVSTSDDLYWSADHISKNGDGVKGFHYGGLGPCETGAM